MTSNPSASHDLNDFSVSYSSLTCPFHNLAIENELIQGNFEGESHLFLYRNEASVVMGRFQVPWREVNMPQFLSRNNMNKSMITNTKLHLVRRRSGGGTVYHDLGNWNFCFIHKKRELPRKQNLHLMIDLLRQVDIVVEANERYDLVYRDHKGDKVYKVSGSAFKQKKDTCLHHGTLLMDASLKSLRGCLGLPAGWQLEGKGVRSVPSPVLNLAEVAPAPEFSAWIGAVEHFFQKEAHIWTLDNFSNEMLAEKEELSSWLWKWGETPGFSVQIPLGPESSFCLEAHKGQCVTAKYQGQGTQEIILCSLEAAQLGAPLSEAIKQQWIEELKLNRIQEIQSLSSVLSYFFF